MLDEIDSFLFTGGTGGAPSASPPGYNPNQLSSLY
jgi:hypothetical protein